MSFHTYPQVSASVNAHKTQSTLMTANPFVKYVTQTTVNASIMMAITLWTISPTSQQPTPLSLCHQLSTNWATITATLVNVWAISPTSPGILWPLQPTPINLFHNCQCIGPLLLQQGSQLSTVNLVCRKSLLTSHLNENLSKS